jgi:hypothetical protein
MLDKRHGNHLPNLLLSDLVTIGNFGLLVKVVSQLHLFKKLD